MTVRRSHLRLSLCVSLALALPFAAACGAGRNTTMDKEHQTPWVAHAQLGSLLITNVRLIPSAATAAGATPAASPSGSGGGSAQAFLVASVANSGNRSDTLTGVSVQGGSVSLASGGTGVAIKPNGLTHFGDPDVGDPGDATLAVGGFSQPTPVGTTVSVTFTFANAGSTTLLVPVQSADAYGSTATSSPAAITGSRPPIEQHTAETPSP